MVCGKKNLLGFFRRLTEYNRKAGKAGDLTMQSGERQIRFPYDPQKAKQAVLWFLRRHGDKMDKMKLVKLIFLGDRLHLQKYGRPIVGGPYCAMHHGPVASLLLDDLKATASLSALGCEVRHGRDVIAQGAVDEDQLSESDLEVLKHIDEEYGDRDTYVLRDWTHELEAWQKNYPDPQAKTSHPLPYEDFFLDLPRQEREMLAVILEEQEARDFFN